MYIAKNNARAQLAGILLIADTTANLEAGKGALFAVTAPEWTYITAFDGSGNIEHMKVTARATDALTIVRAQDGTAEREWPVGTYIECRPIAAAMADYAVAQQVNGATAETSIADADEAGFVDVSASNVLKKITWANIKATLKTYFDTLYRLATDDLTLAAGKSLVFEGTTDDGFETILGVVDPTGDRTPLLPDKSGILAMTSDIVPATQVQSITASMAANAITISASTLTIDFRSQTLTTGTATTVSGDPSDLVIAATDSFGLVTAAGKQRLAILAINNAGTIELAAVSLAGGLPIDETDVITTAAAATLGSHIKAANARTGVAYRVIGYVDATFTTATGWGSLALVQGAGGNAAVGMTSLGFGQSWQDLTASRALGATYYNNTGRPIQVCGYATNLGGLALRPDINGVSITSSDNGSLNLNCFNFIVPPGNSYSLAIGAGSGTLTKWSELR